MYRFKVFENGAPARAANLEGAHLIGADHVPARADIRFVNGQIICETRSRTGAAGLALLWPVAGFGRIMLKTTRLVERDEPYHLHVELARGRLMRISQKREDWGLYDYHEGESLYREFDDARRLLVEALTAPDDVSAARLADRAIAASVVNGERLGVFHADIFFRRRRSSNQLPRRALGCRVSPRIDDPAYRRRVVEAFDIAVVPLCRRLCEPKEGRYQWADVEKMITAASQDRLALRGDSLVSFDRADLPDWTLKSVGRYDRVRDHVLGFARQAIKQFGAAVGAWNVINGVHAHNTLNLSFEQVMDLTRQSAMLVKQLAPKSAAVIGVTLPWGQYYAHDPRSIPPMLYAEMAVQSGVNFDAFGIEIRFGRQTGGEYVRDLMQVSALLDRFGNLGKPVHVTAAGVPSQGDAESGAWRGEWSEPLQAAWLREFYRIALSKPFIETVCWQDLVDGEPSGPHGGLVRTDLSAKPAYDELLSVRRELMVTRSARGGAAPRRSPE